MAKQESNPQGNPSRTLFSRLWSSFQRALQAPYSCFFPAHPGFFTTLTMKLFYSGIRLEEAQKEVLGQIPKDAIIVYASKYKNYFEYYFYHSRLSREKLACPQIAFDYRILFWQPCLRLFCMLVSKIKQLWPTVPAMDPYSNGYLQQQLIDGKAGFVSMVGPKSFYRRFVKSKPDPIHHLLKIQTQTERPVVLIPLLMFFGKNPRKSNPGLIDIFFGPEHRPGRLRQIATLLRNPGKVFVEISEPVRLDDFLIEARDKDPGLQHLGGLATALRRDMIRRFNQHRQSITGPVLKTREELRENILTSVQLTSQLEKYAQRKQIPLRKARIKADDYLDEIAASYSPGLIKIASALLKWIFNSMFEGVSYNQERLTRIKTQSKNAPLIFIPCHKSHIDYLILSYLLYNQNMPCPHVAAGKNLSFWPLGPIFRGGGAFFLRRTFKGMELYSKVFFAYIHKLLAEGFNIEFFIEGGRSRTGKLILPKLGLLSIILEAFKDGACEDLIIVPVYIGYDQVLEENAYLDELKGGAKKQENLSQVIRARKFLRRRYGRIYVRFHDPIFIRSLLERMELSLANMAQDEKRVLYRNLGHRVINAINDVSVITPHSVVAAAILNGSRKRFTRSQLIENTETYLSYLVSHQVELADTLNIDPGHAIKTALDSYVQRKFIEWVSLGKDETDESEQVFTIVENRRPNLEYYKNNCISAFIPAAFTAMAILECDAFQFSSVHLRETYVFLQDLLKNEFAYDVDKPAEYFIRKSVKVFIDDAVLMPHPNLPDTYNLTANGYRKLKLFAGFLATYFESYWIVLTYFRDRKKSGSRDRIKKIEQLGNRMYRKEEVDRKESLSKINYKNAVDYFILRNIGKPGSQQLLDHYTHKLQRYLQLLAS